MKKLTIASLIASSLFANYVQDKKGQIDMHGGKGDKLINQKAKFTSDIKSPFSNMQIQKPNSPYMPNSLIKKEEKGKKK